MNIKPKPKFQVGDEVIATYNETGPQFNGTIVGITGTFYTSDGHHYMYDVRSHNDRNKFIHHMWESELQLRDDFLQWVRDTQDEQAKAKV